MRFLIVYLYMSLLLLLTCTASLTDLVQFQQVRFQYNPNPDFSSFFAYKSFNYNSPAYINQKAGHALCFFILAFMLTGAMNRVSAVVLTAGSFAVVTEVAQLFFSRTGCLVDVLIDFAGVLLFLGIYWVAQVMIQMTPTSSRQEKI